MRVFLTSLGCKLNQAEIESVARRFSRAGHEIVSTLEAADLHVVNTCTVTGPAARESRKTARRGGRLARPVPTVLTGCYVESDRKEAAELAGVDLVVPNAHKDRLVDLVEERFGPADRDVPVSYVPLAFGNARALVKIEDGCAMRCAFCIIPATRGRPTSRFPADVVSEVRELSAKGHLEIVLTGVQISSYRAGGERLADLVRRLLAETAVHRLRLTSIAPWDFDPRLLDLLAGGRVCRHVHLSLQSGSARTLRRMRRPYDPERFARLVETIRSAVPGVAITSDVIVGFPGESDADFEESLAFCRSIGFARLHAFPYSSRPGTEAATMDGAVAPDTAKRRMEACLEVARTGAERFVEAELGKEHEILWETKRDGLWLGTTDNYVRVATESGDDAARRITRAPIERDARGSFPRAVPRSPVRPAEHGAAGSSGDLAR